MSKKKRFLYLLLTIGTMFFDQAFQIFGVIFILPLTEKIFSDPNFYGIIISTIELFIFIGIYYHFFKKKDDLKIFDENYKRYNLKYYDVFLIGMGFIGLVSVWLFLVQNILIKIPQIKASYDYFKQAMDMSSVEGSFISSLIYGSFLAALMEEFLFRGIIHNSLKLFSKSRVFSIIVTGVLFGVWHGILVQGVYAAIGGIFFSYIYERTGKFSITIIVHFINNFLSSKISEIDKSLIGAEKIFNIISVFAVPILIYYMYKIRNKNIFENENQKRVATE